MSDKDMSKPVSFRYRANGKYYGVTTPWYFTNQLPQYAKDDENWDTDSVYSGEYVQSLLGRIAELEEAIRCHRAGFIVCPECGDEIPSSTDDVCEVLRND